MQWICFSLSFWLFKIWKKIILNNMGMITNWVTITQARYFFVLFFRYLCVFLITCLSCLLYLLFSIPISPTPCFHFISHLLSLSLLFLLCYSIPFSACNLPSPHRFYFSLLLSPFSLWYLGQILACQQISDWSVIKSFLFCFLQSLIWVLSSISLLLIVECRMSSFVICFSHIQKKIFLFL